MQDVDELLFGPRPTKPKVDPALPMFQGVRMTRREIEINKAHDEGYEAGKYRFAAKNHPYQNDAAKADAWNRGWQQRQEDEGWVDRYRY